MSPNFSLPCNSPWASRLLSQVSSMLTYWKPCRARPLETIASAAARTLAASTFSPQTFQEFQPIGGVRASLCSPPTIVRIEDVLPAELLTVTRTAVRAGGGERTGDDAGVFIEREAGGKIFGRVGERAIAGGRDEKQKRPAGRRADDARIVNRRLRFMRSADDRHRRLRQIDGARFSCARASRSTRRRPNRRDRVQCRRRHRRSRGAVVSRR